MNRIAISLALVLASADSAYTKELRKPTERLAKQSEQFQQQIVRVADNVYTAVGYSVSNVSMVVGEDGVVIIDTGLSLDDATRIATEFRRLSDKPVEAILFTHSHGDHTGGAAAFLGRERPQVWAHERFGSEALPLHAGGVTFQRERGARQAGFKLPPGQRINNGVAPVRYPKPGRDAFVSNPTTQPTNFLEGERKTITVAGVELELVSSPGETNDQLFVWYPEKKVLFAGDNFYRSFPNLYAIRGTPIAACVGGLRALPNWRTRMLLPLWVATPIRFWEPTRSSKFSATTAMPFSLFTTRPSRA